MRRYHPIAEQLEPPRRLQVRLAQPAPPGDQLALLLAQHLRVQPRGEVTGPVRAPTALTLHDPARLPRRHRTPPPHDRWWSRSCVHLTAIPAARERAGRAPGPTASRASSLPYL